MPKDPPPIAGSAEISRKEWVLMSCLLLIVAMSVFSIGLRLCGSVRSDGNQHQGVTQK